MSSLETLSGVSTQQMTERWNRNARLSCFHKTNTASRGKCVYTTKCAYMYLARSCSRSECRSVLSSRFEDAAQVRVSVFPIPRHPRKYANNNNKIKQDCFKIDIVKIMQISHLFGIQVLCVDRQSLFNSSRAGVLSRCLLVACVHRVTRTCRSRQRVLTARLARR